MRGVVPARIPGALLPLVCLVWALIPLPAAAHPFGAQYYSYQITAELAPDAVGVTFVAEVPTSVVMKEFFALVGDGEPDAAADVRFTAAKLDELRANLQIILDGREITPADVTPEGFKNGVGNSNFFTYTLKLRQPVELAVGERHSLNVLNRNRTGGSAYYRNDVVADDAVKVVTSTHWEAASDPAVQATQGWTREPAQKDLTLAFERVAPPSAPMALAPEQPSSAAPEGEGGLPFVPIAAGVGALIVVAALAGLWRSRRG